MLLPTPEGPDSTIGRLSFGTVGVEAQIEVDILEKGAMSDVLAIGEANKGDVERRELREID